MSDELPSWHAGEAVSARKLTTLTDRTRDLQADRLDDIPPPPPVDRLCEVIPRSKVSGRVGVYNGSRIHGSPVPKSSGNLANADLGSIPSGSDVTIYNLSEAGGSGSELTLDKPYIGFVRIAGVAGKPVIYVMAGGGSLPTPTAVYQVIIATGSPLTWVADFVRAHG